MTEKPHIRIRCVDIDQKLLTGNSFLLGKVLRDDYRITWVTDDSYDVLVQGPFGTQGFDPEFKDAKKIILASENMLYATTVSVVLLYIAKRFVSFDFFVNTIQRIVPNWILQLELRNYRPLMLKKALNLGPNEWMIGTNTIDHPQYLLIPQIFNKYYQEVPSLVDTKDIDAAFKKKKKFCMFAVSNPHGIERNAMFKKLSRYKHVDSFGSVYNNMDVDRSISIAELQKVYEEYKFVLCFENSFAENYISERLVDGMIAHTVPIYRGASNVGDYFNTKAFINYEDYGSSLDQMLARIIELDQDDEQYKQMLAEPAFMGNSIPEVVPTYEEKISRLIQNALA